MLGLGVEDYGSGSESEGEASSRPAQPKRQTHPLPPPPSSKAPVKTKKKVAIGLPSLKPTAFDDEDELQSEMPPAKKPKIGAGAGSSSLLSMLPAPKQKAPIAAPPERVLGGGKGPGLVFNTSRSTISGLSSSDTQIDSTPVDSEMHSNSEEFTSSSITFAFRPPSLAKGKANISLEEEKPHSMSKVTVSSAPAVDFFGLNSASYSKISLPTSAPAISISSAPALPTFDIPEPSVNDPYPGYYQLPSGEWRQHESEYYERFRRRWEKEYNDHVRALEKGAVKGFEGYEHGEVADVDAAKEMERAKKEVKEREERKAISKMRDGEPAKPKMNITASKMSGVARSRHQLATLLHEAYQNKEMLEEKIAEGKRNRKEAGNKYGF